MPFVARSFTLRGEMVLKLEEHLKQQQGIAATPLVQLIASANSQK